MTVARFTALMRTSKLLSDAQVQTVEERWKQEAVDADNVAALTRWLVAEKHLTEYQASQLVHGQLGALFLGPYELCDRIGRGKLAIVYKAVHRDGQTVALKVLPPSRARDPHLLARFRNEAMLACELNHPNVVRAFEAGEAGGVHFLVLEYLRGENLRETIERRGRLPPDDVAHLGRQLLAGVQYLFEQGFVHRNLEPANLMLAVSRGGDPKPNSLLGATVKILDTSLSRCLFEESIPAGEGQCRLTHERQLLGTPEYMAPEQARDPRSTDIRADLYSVGCILYHALTGAPPFHAASPVEVVIRHAVDPPRPLREIRADVPVELARLVERLLAKNPDDRFAAPFAAVEALDGNSTTVPASLAAEAPAQTALAVPLAAPAVQAVLVAPAANSRRVGASVPVAVPNPVAPLAVPVSLVAMAPVAVEPDPIDMTTPCESGPFATRYRPTNVWVYLILGALGMLAAQFVGWMIAYLRLTAT
jgi:tRNA A-37 threonylcarbamoyl transferase component Bud32